MTLLFVVTTVVVVALIFDFTNGFHDSANAMAGPIATGALKPRTAVIIAAILNVVGACLSTEVAKTISGGFFDDTLVTAPIVLAGLVGAIIWNLLTWLLGLPSSSSHALFGGLIGAVIVGAGFASVNYPVIVSKVLLPAVVAPTVAGLAAVGATALAYRITRPTPGRHSEAGFKYGQAFTASLVALAHGTSDGQKTMGVITLVLIVSGYQAAGTGPHWWVVLLAGLAIGLGTYSGGWRIMRTMGKGIVEIETPQGAASGAATSATILASAHLGFGLSTTHVATGSILGSGLGRRGAEVRWSVARRMAVAWLLTLPGAAIVGGLAALLSNHGAIGVIALLLLLAGACAIIWSLSRRNRVHQHNVTDSAEVLVLASASPDTYSDDPRLAPTTKPAKKRKKQKSAAR
ncbi:MAG TPA: inorganic phosphate transporter [Microlunatus sp.]|nr:inorganic phosphate transporter [Microlunatus sp.]